MAFFGKSLIPTLYYPEPFCVNEEGGRRPINTFNIDLGTPAFYEVPINKYVGDMYKRGRVPLWNPYQGMGTPLAAQYSTRAFFPYQILEDISPYWLWDYFMLARLIIAAFFTYLFLRLLGLSLHSAFLGGIFYGLCGSFTWFINLEQFTNVAMMIPICLFSLERLLRFKKARHLAECSVVFALMLLAGQPEISIYVMLLAAVYYVFRVLCGKPKFLALLKAALKFGGLTLLALGICALLILPFLELIPNSYQCHPLGGVMGLQDPTRLSIAIGILSPKFFELCSDLRFFPHNGFWDWLGGNTGILMPFLIVLGFFCLARKPPRGNKAEKKRLSVETAHIEQYRNFFLFFSLFGIFIVLKNFGSPLAAWIGRLPLLDQSWSPRWAGPVWTFSLACAAAIGLEMASHTLLKKRAVLGAGGLVLLIFGFFCYQSAFFPQFKYFGIYALKKVLPPVLSGLVVGILVVLMAAFLFLFSKSRKALIYGMIFLAISELWFSVPKGIFFPWTVFTLIPFLLVVPTVYLLAKEKWQTAIGAIAAIALCFTFIDLMSPQGFPDRKNVFKEPEYIKVLKKDKSHFRIVAGGGILMPNFSSAFKLQDIRYINSLCPVYYHWYVNEYLLKEPHTWPTDRLWFAGVADTNKQEIRSIYREMNDNPLYYSYLGVKYIITPKNIVADLPLVYDKDIRVYEITDPFPRSYIAHSIKMASDFKEAQELMKAEDVDIRNTAILEEQPPSWYKPSFAAVSDSRAQIEEYTPHEVKIKADLAYDGILVLTDVFYPGWKAYADNEESRIYRINGLTRGVFLKKGSHDVIFTYEPMSFKLGGIISLVSIILCAALLLKKQ